MLRKLIGILAATLMVAALGSPGALAGHEVKSDDPDNHEDIPGNKADATGNPLGECAVTGAVQVQPGVDTTPRHNHYEFVSATINCQSTDEGTLPSGEYDVEANGGTDGEGVTNHGETDALGWSHSSGYTAPGNQCDDKKPDDVNKGNIDASGQGKALEGWVKFIRVGTTVEAWGCLAWDDANKKGQIYFQAELEFIPDDPTQMPVQDATLVGAATIFTP